MSQTFRRLSEQDLAQLYVQTEAPLRLDDLLQNVVAPEAGQIAVHDSISGQTPDLALISLSLCGGIVVRDFPHALKDSHCGPVLRELLTCAEDNLMSVGALWLNSHCYNIAPDARLDSKTIASIPDRLRILSSIFLELRDALEDRDEDSMMHHALKTLFYQSESHADLAEIFVDELKAKKAAAKKRRAREVPDQIPLPFDLIRPRMGAEIVAFSLFHGRR